MSSADADALYRRQIAYLFERSQFYRERLAEAGFGSPENVGGLADIGRLPFTEKNDLRATVDADHPIGTHLAAKMDDVVRIYSTSGTTGSPFYIPLTARDLEDWIAVSMRSYAASGITADDRIVSTYNAGPFVAGATIDAFSRAGLTQIPVGAGNTERLMAAVQKLGPTAMALTPSYALHLAEWAEKRDIDLAGSTVKRLLVAGEPGGSEPTLRARLESAWGATVTEAMGIGDISISLWGECEHKDAMHFAGDGYVHIELIDPVSGEVIPMEDGAEGEMVYTHLRREASPLLRFRSRDHVVVKTGTCACGRTGPRIRCIGRTDDMLIVRGVNLFPTALREVVARFAPEVSGVISIRPSAKGVKQSPPLPVQVELAEGVEPDEGLAEAITKAIRDTLIVSTRVGLVAWGSLPRTDYKSKLVDWSDASSQGGD
ncbi:phenylacetate--CoA ligase family protein [Pelagibacterium montanilacus]|uniref:phenylacetate--CoA ligase family protein n=1 Tax=Pelagibacterium montanilacus TaxID=2185280 RepID=UPI000F8F1C3C|nr:AMP-binding protein [Pelagibacterium montanilacus]